MVIKQLDSNQWSWHSSRVLVYKKMIMHSLNITPTTGVYEDNTVSGNEVLSTDSRAVYKPSYKNFHIKCSNNSVIQAVSIFAIGFAEHFVSETGGDQSITNSNSNFGARALIADGFRKDAFPRMILVTSLTSFHQKKFLLQNLQLNLIQLMF